MMHLGNGDMENSHLTRPHYGPCPSACL